MAERISGVMKGLEVRGKKDIDLRGACLSTREDKVVVKRVRKSLRLVGGEE